MKRIDRLVAIITTLQSKQYITAEFIAEKYGISVRTVYRDVKSLGEIGVPVFFEPQKGYSLVKGFFLPPVSFTSDEANSLILLAALSEKFTDNTISKNAESALGKIKAVLRHPDKEKADLFQSQIRVSKNVDENRVDFLLEIQKAIVEKQILQIEYRNNKEEVSQREVEPIGLTFYANRWHLIAWCWLRQDYRDFKVVHILTLINKRQPFRKADHCDIHEYIKSVS